MADKIVQLKSRQGDKLFPIPAGSAVMQGATAGAAGKAGAVPAPSAGDQNKVLKGDGTWGEASGGGHRTWQYKGVLTNKTYSATNTALVSKFFDEANVQATVDTLKLGDTCTDFNHTTCIVTGIRGSSDNQIDLRVIGGVMIGASSSTSGYGGTVPFPGTGAQNKFLRGDGTWADTASSTHLYQHHFYWGQSSSDAAVNWSILSTSSSTMSHGEVAAWLYDHGLKNSGMLHPASGVVFYSTRYVASTSGGATTSSVSINYAARGVMSSDGVSMRIYASSGTSWSVTTSNFFNGPIVQIF